MTLPRQLPRGFNKKGQEEASRTKERPGPREGRATLIPEKPRTQGSLHELVQRAENPPTPPRQETRLANPRPQALLCCLIGFGGDAPTTLRSA